MLELRYYDILRNNLNGPLCSHIYFTLQGSEANVTSYEPPCIATENFKIVKILPWIFLFGIHHADN
jgi:hypothetical protein